MSLIEPGKIVWPRWQATRRARWRRALIRAARLLAWTLMILLLAEAVMLASVLVRSVHEQLTVPALCAGLPDDLGQAEYDFADRVYSRFPVGTPWRDIAGVLREQGFAPVMPEAGRLNPGGRFVIEGYRRDIWCEVRWTTDAAGRATSVRPLFMAAPHDTD